VNSSIVLAPAARSSLNADTRHGRIVREATAEVVDRCDRGIASSNEQ
jgi:hypothetical protein